MESASPSLREQGIQALREGRIDAAIDLLSRAALAGGDDAEAQACLGIACSRNGLHAQARQALEAAVALEPGNADYRFHLGAALEQAGDLSGALRAYREALRIDDSHPLAYARVATLEASRAFSPAADLELAAPSLSSAPRAEAPWLVGPYAAAPPAGPAGTVQCPNCRQSTKPGLACEWCRAPVNAATAGGAAAGDQTAGVPGASPEIRSGPVQRAQDMGTLVASPGLVSPGRQGRKGWKWLLGFVVAYVVVMICLAGWLLARWLPSAFPLAGPPRPSPAVQSLLDQARAATRAGQTDRAEQLYRQALSKARVLSDRPGQAWSLLGLGYLNRRRGQAQRALEYYRPALPIFRQIGDKDLEARTLVSIGDAYQVTGQSQRGLASLQAAVTLFRAVGDRAGEGHALDTIGWIYWSTRRPQKALQCYQQALALARQTGDRRGEARTLGNLGWAYSHTRQPQKAMKYYEQALTTDREVGDKDGEAGTVNNLALVYSDAHQPQRALASLERALVLSRQAGDKKLEVMIVDSFGMVYEATGQRGRALEYYRRTLVLARQYGDKEDEANELKNIARLQRRPHSLTHTAGSGPAARPARG